MKTIAIENLKVGDKLIDETASKYGHFVDMVVNSIRITKANRYVITIDMTYIDGSGQIKERLFAQPYSNGALTGYTTITIQ